MKRLRFLLFFITIIISVQIFAINSFASATTTFDHKEATALIGFIFDINPDEIREIDWDENSIYKLLTGQYQNGSREEAVAKIAFLSVAYENINQNIGEQNNALNASRAHLLDYLEKHASEDIAGDMANGIIKDVLKSVSKCVMYEICGWDMDIIETFELSYDTIKDIKSLPDKAKSYAEKVQTAVVAGMEVASSNKRNMYMYFREYVNANVSMGEYADLYMEAYDLQLSQTIIAYDPILNWHSENNIQTLKRWAKYVADIELSLSHKTESDTNFVAKFVLNYPFAQDVVCYTTQETINFIQNGMYKQEREGYTFVNWYYDAAGTIEYDGDFYEGIVLYAKWNKKPQTKFTITFDSNCSEVDDFSYIYDTTVGNWIDHNVTRPGYIFEGWYWDADCTQKASGTTITINQNLTFYAKWVRQFNYTVSNGRATITGINGYQTYDGITITNITIPSRIDGYPVLAIGKKAFYQNSKITNVTIENGLTNIDEYAFFYCDNLVDIAIPDTVINIGDCAFDYCDSLTNITIPNSVTSIGAAAFSNCDNLKSIVLPDSIIYLGQAAFANCWNLSDVVIESGMIAINNNTFSDCRNLTNITMADGIKVIDDFAFINCSSLKKVTIPDSVTRIGKRAFDYCYNLTDIEIGQGVESIEESAFAYCSKLSKIYIPMNVINISPSAFNYCDGLISIEVNENNPNYSSLSGHLFNKEKSTIIKYANGKKDDKYEIPFGVTVIGDYAFDNCTNLLEIVIADSVKHIGAAAFRDCYELAKVTMSTNLTTIDNYAFDHCYNLRNITLPNNLLSIGEGAFQYCNTLTTVVIPDGVTNIGKWAFNACGNLTSIVIPNSLTYIDDYTFMSCYNLESISLPKSIISIGKSAFSYCEKLMRVTFNDGLISLGEDAFSHCNSLTNAALPDTVISIGQAAFNCCNNLRAVTFSNNVRNIGNFAFSSCDSIEKTYYRGTKNQWNSISIGTYNSAIKNNIIYVKHTKTEIFENGKTFIVNPVNVDEGKTVIITLYKNNKMNEVQSTIYKSEKIEFETTKEYDTVKIMVWEDFEKLIPITEVEVLK